MVGWWVGGLVGWWVGGLGGVGRVIVMFSGQIYKYVRVQLQLCSVLVFRLRTWPDPSKSIELNAFCNFRIWPSPSLSMRAPAAGRPSYVT